MKEDNTTEIKETALTEEEELFCNLYVFGDSGFAGQHMECYCEIFGEDEKNIPLSSRRFLAKPNIQIRIKELAKELQAETENIAVKLQVAETLKSVMKETSTAHYNDKFGFSLSPAPLRAVSVNAAKALMDIYPIKHAHEAKLRIDSNNGGIVFNVIVPDIKNNNENEDRPEDN